MIIVCPTVPHTGTHFIRDLLLHAPREPGIERVLVVHPYSGNLGGLQKLADADEPFIIPRRDLASVRASWVKYGKNLDDFAGMSLKEWLDVQDELAMRAVTFWLSIDKPGVRDVQLSVINRELKLDLVTDWKPVRQAPVPFLFDTKYSI